jgi:alkyl hydroperoxide reductase subunit AhpC
MLLCSFSSLAHSRLNHPSTLYIQSCTNAADATQTILRWVKWHKTSHNCKIVRENSHPFCRCTGVPMASYLQTGHSITDRDGPQFLIYYHTTSNGRACTAYTRIIISFKATPAQSILKYVCPCHRQPCSITSNLDWIQSNTLVALLSVKTMRSNSVSIDSA